MRKTLMLSIVIALIIVAAAIFMRRKLQNSSHHAIPVADKSTATSDRLVVLNGRLYSIRNGALYPLPVKVDGYTDIPAGKGPAISPNGQWVAYISSNELFIYSVGSGEAHQVTNLYRPLSDQFLGVDVYLQGWSHDGSRVLFRVTPGADCEDCELKLRPADYGYFTYNIANQQLAPVRLLETFDFRAWLPDGSYLGTAEMPCGGGSTGSCKTLVIAREGVDQPRALEGFNGDHLQLTISADGRFAVTTLPFMSNEDRSDQSQIVKIDLSNGNGEMLTDIARAGQWQRPRFSPEGSAIAWKFYDPKPNGFGYVYVHGHNDVYRCKDLEDYDWADEQHIVVECGNSVDLIDTTGKLVTQYPAGKNGRL